MVVVVVRGGDRMYRLDSQLYSYIKKMIQKTYSLETHGRLEFSLTREV